MEKCVRDWLGGPQELARLQVPVGSSPFPSPALSHHRLAAEHILPQQEVCRDKEDTRGGSLDP